MTTFTKKLEYSISFLKFVKKHVCFRKLKYFLPRAYFENKKINTINKIVNLYFKLNKVLIFFMFFMFFFNISPSWAMSENDKLNKNVLMDKIQ